MYRRATAADYQYDDGIQSDTLKIASQVNGAAHWYAIYLRSQFEKKVHEELCAKGVESFLPLIEEIHIWSDRKKRVHEPLFKGYLFVRTDLQNKIKILETKGVVRFVGIRNRPSLIPEEQINWVRIVIGYPQSVRRESHLTGGQRVQIIAGPFKGIQGVVSKILGPTRVVISLDEIAQSFSIEVAPEFLQTLE